MAARKPLAIEEPGAVADQVEGAAAPAADPVDDDSVDAESDAGAPEPAAEVQPVLIERPTGHLPEASDVDAAKIRGNVLTKQGWVIPDQSTARAAN